MSTIHGLYGELTAREREVLALMARGLTNGQIAEELDIGFETAKTHVARIIAKTGASNREEAVIRYREWRGIRATARRRVRAVLGLPVLAKTAIVAGSAGALAAGVAVGVVLYPAENVEEACPNGRDNCSQVAAASPSATPFDPTPDLTATPVPDRTPDLDQPGWYVPYLNRDRELPTFEGELAGIGIPLPVDPGEDETCDGPLSTAWGPPAEDAFGSSPVGVQPDSLSAAFEFFSGPDYTVCESETPIATEAVLRVLEPPGGAAENHAGPLGIGSVTVRRHLGPAYTGFTAAAERWSEGAVAGFEAAVLEPVIESVGMSAIAVHDPTTGVTTVVWGHGVYLESLEAIMEWLLAN